MTSPLDGEPQYQWTEATHQALLSGMTGEGVDKLTQLATGNPQLVTNPALLFALHSANAKPEQAQAINQFMAGLDAEKQVHLARAGGQKTVLSYQQQSVLDHMGVDYSDVNQSPQQAQDGLAGQLASQGLEVARDQNGNALLNKDGTPVVQKQDKPAKKKGWSFMRVLSDTGSAISKPWNAVDASVTKVSSDLDYKFKQLIGDGGIDPTSAGGAGQKSDSAEDQARYARDAGYDPDNFFSMIAYEASGKSHMNISQLADNWDKDNPGTGVKGKDALDQALQFANDPAGYRRNIENDPNTTMEQKVEKLGFLNSPQFADLAKRVGARTASIGNGFASGAGLDPVKNSTAYAVTSAGVDFAASIALDPTILVGKAFAATRLAALGIRDTNGILDGTKIEGLFKPMSAMDKVKNPFVAGLQRRWGNYLDQTQEIARVNKLGEAATDADKVSSAQAYQKIQSQFSELAPLVPDMTGASKITGFADGKVVTASGEAFTNLEDVGKYLNSKMAMVRLVQGKAAQETNLMPGATSLYGFRAMKGSIGEMLAGKTQKINLNKLNNLTSILPSSVDAVDASGKVIAAEGDVATAQTALDALETARGAVPKTNVGKTLAGHLDTAKTMIDLGDNPADVLASAKRAMMNDPVLKGQVQNNLLRRGTADGEGFNLPGMLVARGEQTARRLGSLLPRNTMFDLGDPASVEKVYRYMQMYANKGDAALVAAQWAGADEATQRALITGIQLQTMHAAGFGFTESGRATLEKVSAMLDNTTGDLSAEKSAAQKFSPTGLDIGEDPLMGGQAVHYGLFPADIQKSWSLDSFAQLQRNAQRFGLWDRILGRAFTSQTSDQVMHGFKMAQLEKPSTFTRNLIEGWGNAILRGEGGAGIKAKHLAVQVEQETINALKEQAKTEGWTKAELRERINAESPLKRGMLAQYVPQMIMGRWYHQVLDKTMGEDDKSNFILRLLHKPGENQRMMDAYGLQHAGAELNLGERGQLLANSEAGLGSAQLSFGPRKEIDSYEIQATDGFDGAARYEQALGRRLNQYPEYGKALLDQAKSGDGDLAPLLKIIHENPALEQDLNHLRFSTLFKNEDDEWTQAVTADDKAEALRQLVDKQVKDLKYHMTGTDGKWLQKVDDHFRSTGRGPDANWISKNLKGGERPAEVVAPTYAAVPLKSGPAGFVNALFEGVDKAYVRMVEDPIQRTTSMPIFLNNYGEARVAFSGYEKRLIEEHGFSPETADNLVQEYAMKHSWVKTENTIDDPGLKAQFDVVGRNFFGYSRAVQAMIRRWGSLFIQDPTRMVKASLAVQAAEHSGLIWKDQNGDLNFSYPGSGAVLNLFNDAMQHVPVLGGFMQMPTVPDLTGKVMLAVPGLENPFKLSATPLVNVPFRGVERILTGTPIGDSTPLGSDHLTTLMDEIDGVVNGPIGQGEIGSQFEPTALKKFAVMFSHDDRNGMLSSATVGAITSLIAAGDKSVPGPNATPDERQNFIDNIRVQVRNQLFARAVLGLWAPAAPSAPTNATAGSAADYAFSSQGIKSLDQEFTAMLDDHNGDYAATLQLWTALHPDKLIYTQPKSGATSNKAYLPATADALKWTENNAKFIDKYKSVAGYFLPESTGEFSSTAYALQLKIGLREKKTPEEFLDTAMVNIARPDYKKMTDNFDAQIAGAHDAGDADAEKTLKKARADAVTQFNALNPLYAAQAAGYAVKGVDAKSALASLRQVVADKSVPSDIPIAGLKDMIASWDNYQAWKGSVGNSNQAERDARTVMAAAFDKHMSSLVANNSSLSDLYNGIFRQLDNALTDPNATN